MKCCCKRNNNVFAVTASQLFLYFYILIHFCIYDKEIHEMLLQEK